MTASIALEGVSFRYPNGHQALGDVDLGIRPGERVGIVGQNGSGKSTLVRHLVGLLRPTRGRVLLDGEDIAAVPTWALARRVGLLFQNPDLQLFEERIRAEVEFGPRNLGRRGAELDRAVGDALEAVGLAELADTNPFLLGHSRRKLVALASILAMETGIVVLDEPTTGQDARGVHRVRGIVAALAATGRTVVAISHDLRFVAESFERVVVLQGGRVILDGPPSTVFDPARFDRLAQTHLEPPPAARAGARFGLGSTPTEAAFLAALASRGAASPGG